MGSSLTISRIIRITLLVLFVLALFRLGGLINPWSILVPRMILVDFEFWRLITYPIALNFGGLLIGSIVFSQPGEEIESMFGKGKYGLALIVVTLLTALIHLGSFWGSSTIALSGPINISLFVMVGYVYLFPSSSVTIIFFSLQSKILLLLMVGFVLLMSGLAIANGIAPQILLSEGLAGLISGVVWFHILYQKYPIMLGAVRTIETLFARREPISNRRGYQKEIIQTKKKKEKGDNSMSDEERLNLILEKIAEKGSENLTKEEQNFLNEYSSRL